MNWKIDSLPDDPGAEDLIVDTSIGAHRVPVALVYRPPFGADDWQARAKLIAAAPDVYAALRFLLDTLGDFDCHLGGDYHEVGTRRYAPTSCPACKAQAALAKADGVTS